MTPKPPNFLHEVAEFCGKLIAGFFVVLLIGFTIQGCEKVIAALAPAPKKCAQKKTVSSVGGCDALGNCGVTFDDGSHSSSNKPSPGQEICVKWKDAPQESPAPTP